MYIRGKPSILHRVAFELRYRYGFTYLDRCGKTINAIMKISPEWMPKSDQVSPQNAPMVSTVNQCVFNFSYQKLDLAIDQPANNEISQAEIDRFCEQVGSVSSVVVEQLGLKEFPRIGFRSWHLFPCRDREEAERWLGTIGLFSVPGQVASSFEGEIESVGAAIVIAGLDRNYRIGLNGVERAAMLDLGSEILAVRASGLSKDQDRVFKRQNRQPGRMFGQPQFAAMIDIDCYQNDPDSIEPEDFVRTSLQESRRRIEAATTNKGE